MAQAKEEKNARKRKLKAKKKLEEKLRLKTIIPGDDGPTDTASDGLFSLQKLSQVRLCNWTSVNPSIRYGKSILLC